MPQPTTAPALSIGRRKRSPLYEIAAYPADYQQALAADYVYFFGIGAAVQAYAKRQMPRSFYLLVRQTANQLLSYNA